MKDHRSTSAVALLALTFLAASTVSVDAPAEQADAASAPPPPASVAAPSSTAPSSARVEDGVPTERSKAPSAEEWAAAPRVRLSRASPRAAGCLATRVREWLRVRCLTPTFAISLLGGSNDGLAFWIGKASEGGFGEVQLPLRRGDRRVVQLWATRDAAPGSAIVEPSLVLQELWPDGEATPTVTVL